MKLAVIIPDRGDRPYFTNNCLRMIRCQTLMPQVICHVDYKPKGASYDLTERYQYAYDNLRGRGFDLIAFIENDDYYAPTYLERMAIAWGKAGTPDLFGTDYTYYYQLSLRKYFKYEHAGRASMMNTVIRADLKFDWPKPTERFVDMWLWKHLDSKVTQFKDVLSIGMKHGVGLCGGTGHKDKFARYTEGDQDFSFLLEHLDSKSYEFYTETWKKSYL